MNDLLFSFNSQQLDSLFPNYVLLAKNLSIVSCGKLLANTIKVDERENFFFDCFTIIQPTISAVSYNSLLSQVGNSITIKHKQNASLELKGLLIAFAEKDQLLLALTQHFESTKDIATYEAQYGALNPNQNQFDLLSVVKNQEIENADTKKLLQTISNQKDELKRLSLIAEQTFNGIIITDRQARIQWVNKAFEKQTGYSLSEMIGKKPGEMLQGPETNPETVNYLRDRIQAGEPFDCEIINYSKDKTPYWIRISGQPIFDDDGKIVQFFALEENITERKLSEKKLDEQRHFYEDVLNNIPSDIAVFDNEHRYMFLNPVAVRDSELRNWIIGKKDEDYCIYRNKPFSMVEHRRTLFNTVMASKKLHSWEEKITNKAGESEYHLRLMYPVLDEYGEVKLMIGYGVNITERKLFENQLKRKEKQYRDLFDYSQALICTHDLAGRIITVNPSLCSTLGYEADELKGRLLYDFIPQRDKEKFHSNYLDTIINEEKAGGVFRVLNKNGKVLFLLYQNYKVEELGEEPYVIGFSQDITDRVKAEHELLIAKKLTEDSARAKEAFLANMSHEIRTPMHGILGVAGLLAKTNLDDQQKNYIKLITESANNLVVIVNDILDIEKITSGKFEFESIDFIIVDKLTTTIQSFQYKAEEKQIQLELKYAFPATLIVKGDPYRLSQIMNNLLSNALKFTKHGKIVISMNVISDDAEQIILHFSVSDTGIGIQASKLSVIFDPFVQASTDTTRKYGGTGLGLSICKNLVEKQGGKIEVTSKEHVGTTFAFTIPFKQGKLQETGESKSIALDIALFPHKKILMAEDVVVNQFLAKVILESIGFSVDIANNGFEAIEMLHENDYDLILMDVQMPEMDGITATQEIRKLSNPLKASIPIIALTANALVGNEEEYYQAGMNGCLTKPFTEEKLFSAIGNLSNTGLFLQV